MTRYHPLVAGTTVVVLSCIMGACGGRTDAASGWDGTMRDSAGVVLLSDGRVVIGDALYHNVRFFSPEGVHLATVGREGAGPGEFGGRIDLMLGAGDTVLAVDWGNRQANTIAPDGTWLGSFSIVPSDGYRIYDWDDDEATGQIVSHHRPLLGDAAPADPRFDLLIRRDFSGAALDTVARLPAPRFTTGDRDAFLVHYYRPESHYDLCDGMVVTGFSDQFRITWNRPDGTVERVATLEREPLRLTSEDEAALMRRIDEMVQDGAPPERVADYKARVRFTSTYPAYRRFVCGPAGTLLVQRIKPRHAFTRDTSGTWLMTGLERGALNVPFAAVWQIDGIGP